MGGVCYLHPNIMKDKINKVRFVLEHRKDKVSKELIRVNVPVNLRFCYGGIRFEYYTGERVNMDKWDFETERAVNSSFHAERSAKDINDTLSAMEKIVKDAFNLARLQNITLSNKLFKDKLNEKYKVKVKKISDPSLIFLFDQFITEGGGLKPWSAGLTNHFTILRNQLAACIGDLKTVDVDDDIYIKFKDYLDKKEAKKQTIESYKNSTMLKKLRNLKWFLRKKLKTHVEPDVYDRIVTFKLKLDDQSEKSRIKQSIVVLSLDEYKQLRDYKPTTNKHYLERVQDAFIFGCQTGLRHSDLKNLKKSDIDYVNDEINITTSKDQDALTIPLSKRAKSILMKYNDAPGVYALSVPTNQRMNTFLKELGLLAGLNGMLKKVWYSGTEQKSEELPKWQYLTCHVSRKTFCTLAVYLGFTIEEVLKITGQSSYDILKLYLEISAEKVKGKMDKFDEL